MAADAGPRDPVEFQAGCVSEYWASCTARGFSPVTIENDTGVLDRLLTLLGQPAWEATAEDVDRVCPLDEFNAARHVGDDSPSVLAPPTPERVTVFFDFLKDRIATARKYAPAARDYALFRTLYHIGLRSEECALLERTDVHFTRGRSGKLHVRFGKAAHTSGPRPRWVPMLDGLDLVLRWFERDVRGRFPDESGRAFHRSTIRNRLRYLMNLEGRPATERFSPHALRRACATHNYERGMDLIAIQQLLGHWTVSSTMTYVRPLATFIEDAYRRAVTSTVNELIGQDPST